MAQFWLCNMLSRWAASVLAEVGKSRFGKHLLNLVVDVLANMKQSKSQIYRNMVRDISKNDLLPIRF